MLVGGQVAVSVVLLLVAMLMYRSFRDLAAAGPGFRTDRLLQISFNPTLVRYSEAQAQQFFDQIADRARSVAGVKSAALASVAPSDNGPGTAIGVVPEEFQFPPGTESVGVLSSVVDDRYFDTIGVPLLKGRAFRATDAAGTPLVAIVNERFGQLYWPAHDPIGKRVRVDEVNGPWAEVVGVVKNTKVLALSESPRPLIYLAFRQRPQPRMTLLVESIGDPASLAAPLRELVRSLDANLPVYNVRTVEESYRMRMVSIFNVVVELVGAMETMGLGLAIVELYGLVAYAASRRTKEIGIRMAIGAERSDVLRMMLRQGMALAVAGLGVGLVAGLVAIRAPATVFPRGAAGGRADVVAFLAVAVAVLAVTFLATYVPARCASRVNPIEALRHE